MRYQNGEIVRAAQFFETGRTINVQVLNLATDAALSTTVGTATESAVVGGLYVWPTSDLVTPLASFTEVAVVFTDATSGLVKVSKLVLRGYVDNLDAPISGLNNLSSADITAALDVQGLTSTRAGKLDNLDNLDATISSIATAIAGLNDITVAQILAGVTGGGDTVDQALARLEVLDEFLQGGRNIDFTGNDALGWQRVERDTAGVEVARYNLFDEAGARITGTVSVFISNQKMIASEVKI